jgi:AAA15 family ATPase/GTPase
MELLYVWVEDYFVLKNISFNFSNRFLVKDVIDIERKNISLELTERVEFVSNFFPNGILSVTAIVGENGVGKSSLLSLINIINHRHDIIGCSWLALYFDHKAKTPVLLGQLQYEREEKWKLVYDKDRIGDFNHIKLRSTTSRSNNQLIITIFYNPSLDFKDYRVSINDIEKGIVDVSTNFLLEDDWENKNTEDSNVDQVTNHRYKNVYRQFAPKLYLVYLK